MNIRDDIERIPELKNLGNALIDYIEYLHSGIEFELKGKRWVASENFVTFTIQHKRARNIALSLRGNPDEFVNFPELSITEGMGYGSYSECKLDNVGQLPAIAMCVQKAYEIYNKGSNRKKTHPYCFRISKEMSIIGFHRR